MILERLEQFDSVFTVLSRNSEDYADCKRYPCRPGPCPAVAPHCPRSSSLPNMFNLLTSPEHNTTILIYTMISRYARNPARTELYFHRSVCAGQRCTTNEGSRSCGNCEYSEGKKEYSDEGQTCRQCPEGKEPADKEGNAAEEAA